jgi:hypothetical protein
MLHSSRLSTSCRPASWQVHPSGRTEYSCSETVVTEVADVVLPVDVVLSVESDVAVDDVAVKVAEPRQMYRSLSVASDSLEATPSMNKMYVSSGSFALYTHVTRFSGGSVAMAITFVVSIIDAGVTIPSAALCQATPKHSSLEATSCNPTSAQVCP